MLRVIPKTHLQLSKQESRVSSIVYLAGSCQIKGEKNPLLLPNKWAKTSIVNHLAQLHNPLVEIPINTGEANFYVLRATS